MAMKSGDEDMHYISDIDWKSIWNLTSDWENQFKIMIDSLMKRLLIHLYITQQLLIYVDMLKY